MGKNTTKGVTQVNGHSLKPWETHNVKFGIYIYQMTIFKRYQVILQPIFIIL
jgi:hypothetical protein